MRWRNTPSTSGARPKTAISFCPLLRSRCRLTRHRAGDLERLAGSGFQKSVFKTFRPAFSVENCRDAVAHDKSTLFPRARASRQHPVQKKDPAGTAGRLRCRGRKGVDFEKVAEMLSSLASPSKLFRSNGGMGMPRASRSIRLLWLCSPGSQL